MRVPAALLVLLAAASAVAAPTDGALPHAGCKDDATCPTQAHPGIVVVDLAFDGLGNRRNPPDGTLAADEIQCAVDCLDGDPAPEHALQASRKYLDPPPYIAGGTLLFLPESPPGGMKQADVGLPKLRYVAEEPIDLPYTSGALTLRGEGATIRCVAPATAKSRTIFRHVVPATASERDVEYLSGFATGWHVEGIAFGDTAKAATTAPSTALELHGAYHLVVERCRFENMGRGVELHMCLMATVRDCFFTGGRDIDVIVNDGTDCGTEKGKCWRGGEGWMRDSGSHHARLLNTHHVTDPSARASVYIARSIGAVLDGPTFEGTRPKNSLLVEWPNMGMEVTVRDVYVEFAENARGTGTMKFDCGGIATIDGLSYVGPYPNDVLIDASGTTELKLRVQRCGFLSPTVQFSNGANRNGNTWVIRDVMAAGPQLTDVARWKDGAIPVNLTTAEAGGKAR